MSQLDIKIRKLQDNGSTFRANIETLYLGGVRSAKVDELRFELPEEWKKCTVTLHVQRLSGTKPDPQILDENNSALVDRRWTLEKEGTWMLLAINDSGYIAMTKPGKYTCYDTIDTDTTTENITPSIYEQFVAEVTKYAKQALESMNAAKTSETNAKTSETNAKASADKAKASADSMDTSVATCTTKAKEAEASAVRAKTSETNAKASADSMGTSVATCTAKAKEAEASAGKAKTSEGNAKTSEGNAKASENEARQLVEAAKKVVNTDKTLTIDGAPADAKTVGDKFNSIKYAGSASAGGDATRALAVKNYAGSQTIEIGYASAGLTTSNLTHIAGYTDNGTKIKDVSKDVLKRWLGLGSAAYEENTIVRDVGDGRALTFNYSADAVNYNDFTWVPVWINGQMKTVNKNVFSTSDVQSSGSNYIRFGDGTQICWYAINSDGSDYTWSFPVAFSNTEYSVVACPVSFLSFVCKDKRTTSCTLPGSDSTLCHGIAVGRWK